MHPRLLESLNQSDTDFNLAEAALLLACLEYPQLDVASYLQRFDVLAGEVMQRIEQDADVAERVLAINQYLFMEYGFAPNLENFYDPRNSFLNDVLERKTGIPITLSIVYMEVAKRVGLPIVGVSFPGHFLVKIPLEKGDIVLDPFAGGRPLSESELLDRLKPIYGDLAPGAISLEPFLAAADNREILVRMLRNLKAIYMHKQDFDKALSVLNDILAIVPAVPQELRDRGHVYEQLECFRAASQDYQRYLELQPGAPDLFDIRERLIGLKTQCARIN